MDDTALLPGQHCLMAAGPMAAAPVAAAAERVEAHTPRPSSSVGLVDPTLAAAGLWLWECSSPLFGSLPGTDYLFLDEPSGGPAPSGLALPFNGLPEVPWDENMLLSLPSPQGALTVGSQPPLGGTSTPWQHASSSPMGEVAAMVPTGLLMELPPGNTGPAQQQLQPPGRSSLAGTSKQFCGLGGLATTHASGPPAQQDQRQQPPPGQLALGASQLQQGTVGQGLFQDGGVAAQALAPGHVHLQHSEDWEVLGCRVPRRAAQVRRKRRHDLAACLVGLAAEGPLRPGRGEGGLSQARKRRRGGPDAALGGHKQACTHDQDEVDAGPRSRVRGVRARGSGSVTPEPPLLLPGSGRGGRGAKRGAASSAAPPGSGCSTRLPIIPVATLAPAAPQWPSARGELPLPTAQAGGAAPAVARISSLPVQGPEVAPPSVAQQMRNMPITKLHMLLQAVDRKLVQFCRNSGSNSSGDGAVPSAHSKLLELMRVRQALLAELSARGTPYMPTAQASHTTAGAAAAAAAAAAAPAVNPLQGQLGQVGSQAGWHPGGPVSEARPAMTAAGHGCTSDTPHLQPLPADGLGPAAGTQQAGKAEGSLPLAGGAGPAAGAGGGAGGASSLSEAVFAEVDTFLDAFYSCELDPCNAWVPGSGGQPALDGSSSAPTADGSWAGIAQSAVSTPQQDWQGALGPGAWPECSGYMQQGGPAAAMHAGLSAAGPRPSSVSAGCSARPGWSRPDLLSAVASLLGSSMAAAAVSTATAAAAAAAAAGGSGHARGAGIRLGLGAKADSGAVIGAAPGVHPTHQVCDRNQLPSSGLVLPGLQPPGLVPDVRPACSMPLAAGLASQGAVPMTGRRPEAVGGGHPTVPAMPGNMPDQAVLRPGAAAGVAADDGASRRASVAMLQQRLVQLLAQRAAAAGAVDEVDASKVKQQLLQQLAQRHQQRQQQQRQQQQQQQQQPVCVQQQDMVTAARAQEPCSLQSQPEQAHQGQEKEPEHPAAVLQGGVSQRGEQVAPPAATSQRPAASHSSRAASVAASADGGSGSAAGGDGVEQACVPAPAAAPCNSSGSTAGGEACAGACSGGGGRLLAQGSQSLQILADLRQRLAQVGDAEAFEEACQAAMSGMPPSGASAPGEAGRPTPAASTATPRGGAAPPTAAAAPPAPAPAAPAPAPPPQALNRGMQGSAGAGSHPAQLQLGCSLAAPGGQCVEGRMQRPTGQLLAAVQSELQALATATATSHQEASHAAMLLSAALAEGAPLSPEQEQVLAAVLARMGAGGGGHWRPPPPPPVCPPGVMPCSLRPWSGPPQQRGPHSPAPVLLGGHIHSSCHPPPPAVSGAPQAVQQQLGLRQNLPCGSMPPGAPAVGPRVPQRHMPPNAAGGSTVGAGGTSMPAHAVDLLMHLRQRLRQQKAASAAAACHTQLAAAQPPAGPADSLAALQPSLAGTGSCAPQESEPGVATTAAAASIGQLQPQPQHIGSAAAAPVTTDQTSSGSSSGTANNQRSGPCKAAKAGLVAAEAVPATHATG